MNTYRVIPSEVELDESKLDDFPRILFEARTVSAAKKKVTSWMPHARFVVIMDSKNVVIAKKNNGVWLKMLPK